MSHMNIVRDIKSLSEFKKNASKLIKQLQDTRQSIVLTVNGQAVAVLQDAESYQNLIDETQMTESVAVLRERLHRLDTGAKRLPADEVFSKIAEKHTVNLNSEI